MPSASDFYNELKGANTRLDGVNGKLDEVKGKLDALKGVSIWNADELLIYANPNQGSFWIKVPAGVRNEPDLLLSVYDNSGRLVRAQQLNRDSGDPRMDVVGLRPGLYIVTLSGGERTYHESMVVE